MSVVQERLNGRIAFKAQSNISVPDPGLTFIKALMQAPTKVRAGVLCSYTGTPDDNIANIIMKTEKKLH